MHKSSLCNFTSALLYTHQVNTLLEIWRQVKEEAGKLRKTPSQSARLAEPPHVRERLVQEIKFFIAHLRSRANGSFPGGDRPHLVQYVACADKADVKGLVSGEGGSWPRSTVSSRDGRDTPLRTISPGSTEGRSVMYRSCSLSLHLW